MLCGVFSGGLNGVTLAAVCSIVFASAVVSMRLDLKNLAAWSVGPTVVAMIAIAITVSALNIDPL